MDLRNFHKNEFGVLWVPNEDKWKKQNGLWIDRSSFRADEFLFPQSLPDLLFAPSPLFQYFMREEKEEIKPPTEFEVNLTQALVGWKEWGIERKLLHSFHDGSPWEPLSAYSAECVKHCKMVPNENHTCGIYALENRVGAWEQEYDTVLGEVYGWGRYVRGGKGWRSEFAYPKAFYLRRDQEDLVKHLKKYRVPIHLQIEARVFDPAEGGYDEYRQDTPDGSCGTTEDSYSAEDESSQGSRRAS